MKRKKKKNLILFSSHLLLRLNPAEWPPAHCRRHLRLAFPPELTDTRALLLPHSLFCCLLKCSDQWPTSKQASPTQERRDEWSPKASLSIFSWHSSLSPSISLHLFLPAGKSMSGVGCLPVKLFRYEYFLSCLFLFCFFQVHFCFLLFPQIKFSLPLWLFACWTAFCWKVSNKAAFFQLRDEEKTHSSILFLFFNNEWIHRMDTRLLRSDKRWTGGICSTYLNAENSPEKK